MSLDPVLPPPSPSRPKSSVLPIFHELRKDQIEAATNNFDCKLGEGSFGEVFQGELDGHKVAVKRLNWTPYYRTNAFYTDILKMKDFHHPNIVPLLGYYSLKEEEESESCLVHEHVSRGSLSHLLHESDHDAAKELTWIRRMDIAIGAARGLEYLHNLDHKVVHMNLRPANILIDEDYTARISDFGLSKSIGQDNTHVSLSAIMGTEGYLDPEYIVTGHLGPASDVYAFGIVLLELFTGRRPNFLDTVKLTDWVWKKPVKDVVDPNLVPPYPKRTFETIRIIALKCASDSPEYRPSMSSVVKYLEDARRHYLDWERKKSAKILKNETAAERKLLLPASVVSAVNFNSKASSLAIILNGLHF